MPTLYPIKDLIPQRKPFLMVDSIISYKPNSITTEFSLNAENVLCDSGYFTESGLIENIAQSAAALKGMECKELGVEIPLGYIGGVNDLKIHFLPKVNSILQTIINIENEVFNATIVSGRVFCNEQLIAECRLKIFLDFEKKI